MNLALRNTSKTRAVSGLDAGSDEMVCVIARSPSYVAAYTLLASTSGCVLLSALYLMKTACGIDLMTGPSPLHQLFF